IGRRLRPEPEMEPPVVDRIEAALRQHFLRLYPSPITGGNSRADGAAVRLRADEPDLEPVSRLARIGFQIVPKQRRRLVHIHHEDVDIAVIIEIAERAAPAAVRRADTRPRLIDQFFEFPVTQVPEYKTRS